ncbi:3-hydroxyacyl-CoA dehydrogenase/enoyl-CoA hydratase family protein [Oricola cellulosilytica]|uniref:3-hydroxyacyl-CoA dehydrogenase n=1 Tax=Oricola cellulosilytica TaxID=1429082 RepID=A0A4R0PBI5_9HYPH|nr:3-hydroxyacyl-CoA dehydrogenase/enoyl-CoA hydratase family protein [Oricola cellulosilytica]TCD12307.1 3-hydroxyacyl-CoA dehydrogenase [Oricola cellulosilytica]
MASHPGNSLRRVCVIGAGTMGSGIAGQVANAGYPVLLLDMPGNDGNRNAITEAALERLRKSDPPALFSEDVLNRISIGNIEDDLASVADCDWIVEAVVERLDIKRVLYRSLQPHLKPEAIVTSNTSTIPISLLVEEMDDEFARRFAITHFFNPVRYMRLLELVRGEKTENEVVETLADFCDRVLGKGVVRCADTPGFLGNRVGVFALQVGIAEATQLGLDIETADALMGRPMGIPKTGIFGLYDLIGLDLMADVVRSLRAILPAEDPFHAVGGENALINKLCESGLTGNKGRGGFYRRGEDGAKLAIDLSTGDYRPRNRGVPERAESGGLAELVSGDDLNAKFCWNVLNRILRYSASLIPAVTENPQDIDDAMKLGYNWIKGPFEMLDEIGVETFVARCQAEDLTVPDFLRNNASGPIYRVDDGVLQVRRADGAYRPLDLPEGVVRFHLKRRELEPDSENPSASLFTLESGIRLVEFHTKANALDADSMALVREAAENPGRGIIIHNDGQHFSAGVNLQRFREFIDAGDWSGIDAFLDDFQQACRALKYCAAPVVGAPSGLSIGGGFEVLAHCSKLVVHTNVVLGLVESLVGLVPGGGGVKETFLRWYRKSGDWEQAAWNAFKQIGYGRTASSPDQAKSLAYFLPDRDETVMNRDRLMSAATRVVGEMESGYRPPEKPEFQLLGGDLHGRMHAFLEKGLADGTFHPHDVTVGSEIAAILTGGEQAEPRRASEQDLYDLERSSFVRLARTPQTRARIEAMLSGKGTLRN